MSEFKRDVYKETMEQIRVPVSMRSRILNMETGEKGPGRYGRRRFSAVLVTCLLVVLVSGTALAVSSGESLRSLFQRDWQSWNGEEMSAEQLAVIDGLTTPLGLSKTIGNTTVTLDSVVYSDGVFWMLVNAADISGDEVYDSRDAYGYREHELEITASDGTDLTWSWGARTYSSLDSRTVHMLIDGELNPDLAPEMEGQTATFRLSLTDLKIGNGSDVKEMVEEGAWIFEFQIPLTAMEEPAAVEPFQAEQMLPGGAMTMTEIYDMEITSVGVTYWTEGENVAHTELPRLHLKNGGEVGCGGGLSEQQEDGSWKVQYHWSMPVSLEQMDAIQLGSTVVEIEP